MTVGLARALHDVMGRLGHLLPPGTPATGPELAGAVLEAAEGRYGDGVLRDAGLVRSCPGLFTRLDGVVTYEHAEEFVTEKNS